MLAWFLRDDGAAMPPSGRCASDSGVTLPTVAVTMVLLIVAGMFAVDVGRLIVTAQKARIVADFAALDGARELDGRSADAVRADVEAAATASAERNGYDHSEASRFTVLLGRYVPGDREDRFQPVTDGSQVPDAVQVFADLDQRHALTPGHSSIVRSAVARAGQDALAAVRLATTTAAVDSTRSAVLDAVVGQALGGSVALTALGWQRIADAGVRLSDLAVQLGVDPEDVDALLDTVWGADQLVLAIQRAVAGTPAAPILGSLVGTAPLGVRLGDILHLDLGAGPSLHEITVGALDLLDAAASAAVVGRSLVVELATVLNPAVGRISLQATIVEPPRWAVGPVGTSVESAQVRTTFTVHLLDVAGRAVDLPIVVDTGQGVATISSIDCGTAGALGVLLDVATATVRVGVGTRPPSGSLAPARLVNLAGVLRIDASADATVASAHGTPWFPAPFTDTPQRVAAPTSPTQALRAALVLQPSVLGLDPLGTSAALLATIVTALDGALTTTVYPVLDTVVPPALDALGAQAGIADVAVPWARCARQTPVLVG